MTAHKIGSAYSKIWDRGSGKSKKEAGAMTPANPQPRTRRKGKKFRDVEKYENPSYAKLLKDERAAKIEFRKEKAKKQKKVKKLLTNAK